MRTKLSSVVMVVLGAGCAETTSPEGVAANDKGAARGGKEGTESCHHDLDEDGFEQCSDCDDDDAAVYPGAPETCDLQPNDCSNQSSWTPEDEDGTVAHLRSDGRTADLTPVWQAGGVVELPTSGTVQVCAGVYDVRVRVASSVAALVGVYGADRTTLDAGLAGPGVDASSSDWSMRGLALRHGAPGVSSNLSHTVIEDSVIADGVTTGVGGGLRVSYGDLELKRTLVFGNQAGAGGGLSVVGGSAEVTDSVFEANSATEGGGVYAACGGHVWLSRSDLHANDAGTGGGLHIAYGDGAHCAYSSATLDEVNVTENEAQQHGGGIALFAYASPTLVLRASHVDDNSAGEDGGGLASLDGASVVEVVDSSVDGNQALRGGGLAWVAAACTGKSSLTGNEAKRGGALFEPTFGFESWGCDLGEGTDDNQPNDVEYLDGATFQVGRNAYLVCADGKCQDPRVVDGTKDTAEAAR